MYLDIYLRSFLGIESSFERWRRGITVFRIPFKVYRAFPSSPRLKKLWGYGGHSTFFPTRNPAHRSRRTQRKTDVTHILSLFRGLSLGVDDRESLLSPLMLEFDRVDVWRGRRWLLLCVCRVTVDRAEPWRYQRCDGRDSGNSHGEITHFRSCRYREMIELISPYACSWLAIQYKTNPLGSS